MEIYFIFIPDFFWKFNGEKLSVNSRLIWYVVEPLFYHYKRTECGRMRTESVVANVVFRVYFEREIVQYQSVELSWKKLCFNRV